MYFLANDVILSHMVTFLNDKTDKNLRASFFDNFVNVASFVGSQCSPILSPLLQQVLLFKFYLHQFALLHIVIFYYYRVLLTVKNLLLKKQ